MRFAKRAVLVAALFLPVLSLSFAAESRSAAGEGVSSLDFANGLYARRMYGPAVSEYTKFIDANPGSPELGSARFRLADSTYFMKDYGRAIAGFREFIKNFPDDARVPMADFRIACAKFYLKEYATSQKIFFRLARNSDDTVIRSGSLFYFGKVYEATGRAKRALKIFERVIQSYPDSEYAAYAGLAVGDVYASQKKYAEAVRAYEAAARKTEPAFAVKEAALSIAEIYLAEKRPADARGYYAKVYELVKNTPLESSETREISFLDQAVKGELYADYALKDAGHALELYRTNAAFFAQSPSRHEALYVLALTAAQAKNQDTALEIIERLIADKDPANVYAEKARLKKAEVLLDGGKTADAERIFAEIAAGAEGDAAKRARYFTAVAHLKAGDRAQAEKDFLAYAAHYPADADAERAYLQAIQVELDLEDYTAARDNAAKFSERFPSSTLIDVADYKQGLALTGLKRHEEAAALFQKVLNDYKESLLAAESAFGAAASFESLGRSKEAAAFYEKLMKDHPEHALAKESLLRLAHLDAENGEYAKAAAIYEDVLFNRPAVPMVPEQAFWLVRQYLDEGRYADMQRVLTAIAARFPGADLKHEMAFFEGESALGSKNYALAQTKYKEAIAAKADGDFVPHAHLGLGIALAAQNQWVEAENELGEALKYDNEIDVTLRARFEVAGLRLRAGDVETAAKTYMLVAILYDDDKYCSLALSKAAECYESLGQKEQAAKVRAELSKRYPQAAAKKAGV